MTLEQKIRNKGETGVIGVTYVNLNGEIIDVLDDYEGVLKCKIYVSGFSEEKFLNGDNFFDTHEEAFAAEL